MKNVAVLTDGGFALSFRPQPGAFDSSRVPTPGNVPPKAKNHANAQGISPGGGDSTCVYTHINFTRVNKIETKYKVCV